VVSSGDPGIFAMATAVVEELHRADDGRYRGVEVSIVPGVTAASAAAARVGAPLGHDFCCLSLSDVLKPWAVVEQRLEAVAGPTWSSRSTTRSRVTGPGSSAGPWRSWRLSVAEHAGGARS